MPNLKHLTHVSISHKLHREKVLAYPNIEYGPLQLIPGKPISNRIGSAGFLSLKPAVLLE